ncbi:PaaI family thioesterase [Paracidovorax cattleyae]|nr:PaaI family thioesterase [Paracidovorax cattleyae]
MSRSPEEAAAMPRSDAEWLAYGRDVLARQPFSQLLGAELTAFSPSRCELRLPVTPQLLQQHGFVHGGVVSYLADNALTYAGGAALRGPVVTSELKVNYLRPARGESLVARAETLHCGRTQAVCRCEVYAVADGVEKLCAAAQGTIATLPPAPGG